MIVMRITTDEVQVKVPYNRRMRKIMLVALVIAAFAFPAAAQISEGDQHWNARAEGHVGGRAKAAQIDAAIAAYQKAVAQDPNNLEARWKLLRAMRFKGAYVASTVDEKKTFTAARRPPAKVRWRSSIVCWRRRASNQTPRRSRSPMRRARSPARAKSSSGIR